MIAIEGVTCVISINRQTDRKYLINKTILHDQIKTISYVRN